MTSSPLRITLHHHARVPSTMDVLDEAIATGAREWTVVLADEQTAGLGRAGRRWEAEPGTALLCSILVRPRRPSITGGMTAIAAGVAVAEVIETLGISVHLKWPNDVLLDGRKVGGVLIRARRDALGPAANIGIGVNLTRCSGAHNLERAFLSDALNRVPTPSELLPTLAERLDDIIHRSGVFVLREAWMRRAALIGEPVVVDVDGATADGRMVGIDGEGALLVEEIDGTLRRVVAGDLVRGPRAAVGGGLLYSDDGRCERTE